jgi:phenylpyruvate tautomerase PptA (4-oxalocrotonate tautomerase family)
MPLAKIHVLEGRYSEERLDKVSAAIQSALINTLGIPTEDYFQLVFEFPKARFRHTPSFVGMHYTNDFIILDLIFIEGRPKETRLALLKDVNARISAEAGVSPDDMMITLYEAPGENSPSVGARPSEPTPSGAAERVACRATISERGLAIEVSTLSHGEPGRLGRRRRAQARGLYKDDPRYPGELLSILAAGGDRTLKETHHEAALARWRSIQRHTRLTLT